MKTTFYELLISTKYLKAKRKNVIVSVVTFISMAGVALGVFALITVIAVMSGFEQEFREKMLGTNSHIMALKSGGLAANGEADEEAVMDDLKTIEGVVGAAPFIYSKVLINRGRHSDGIVLKGIDPRRVGEVVDLERYMREGRLSDLEKGTEPGIILGRELARSLAASLYDRLNIIIPGGRISPAGAVPRSKEFKVVGIFESGMFDFDSTMAYISIGEAEKALRLTGAPRGFEVKVTDIFEADRIADIVQQKVGLNYWVRDWMEMNKTFFSALKLEKIVMFIILALIVFVAAFNIIGTLTMMVMEKHKDIGILMSLGARKKSILLIFLMEGIIIGIVGTIIGGSLGLAVCWFADATRLITLEGDVYYLSYLPFKIKLTDVVIICCASLGISFAATLYPSWKASCLNPAEAIRYE